MSRDRFEAVRERAGQRCEYCQMPASCDPIPFEIDHIIARKHGGATEPGNLALSCFSCNVHKGPNLAGLDPLLEVLTRLFHPRADAWAEHFAWQGPTLLGLTAIGRTTIAVLVINASHRQALRAALQEEGIW